jgi:glycosyltransferase involved in cell wall biosynthesis
LPGWALGAPESLPAYPRGLLTGASTVLAVVPQYRCEPWLADCLDSLVRQTRPLDGIVVIDDASGEPPLEIVRRFPQVTLLVSAENSGPYRLSQEAVLATGYDAYFFQDADDWSMPRRLERELLAAEASGAEMIGCQGHRLIGIEGESVPLTFPLDVNAALAVHPGKHAIMHPSTLVSRDLILRAGGYATGLRFGGDTEFEHRATHVGRIVNIPQFEYVVRNRVNSLTSSPETGLESPERIAQRDLEAIRARENRDRVVAGQPVDLTPLATRPPLQLEYLAGPRLRGADGGGWPA